MKTQPKFQPGDYVYMGSSHDPGEYGRIVHTWWNPKMRWWDCYVAFFGFKPLKPNAPPKHPPYILRYLETSLTLWVSPKRKNKR